MGKILTIIGLVIAALIALVFLLDLALGIPFGRHSLVMDLGFLTSALILAYLSWHSMRETT